MEDDSCRRAGSIPFKWEVCPGTPKHTRSASAAAALASSKVSPAKLTPPPSMASSYCSSPSPYYYSHSSPRVVSSARSASVSPCRRRPYAYGGHRRAPPTAFIDATPRAATALAYAGAGASEAETAAPAAAFGCFSLPMLRRKGSKKGGGGSRSSFGSSSSSSAGSFRSDGELGLGMRRSASILSASSLPLPPGRRRYAEARAEVDAATGRGWFFLRRGSGARGTPGMGSHACKFHHC